MIKSTLELRQHTATRLLACLVVILMGADGVLTFLLVGINGNCREGNPFMAPFASSPLFPIGKIVVAIALVLFVDRRLRKSRSKSKQRIYLTTLAAYGAIIALYIWVVVHNLTLALQ